MDKKVAVIDLGTNTFHMLIAEWGGNAYHILYRERLAVKLGLGGINRGVITDAGIARGLAGLRKFRDILQEAGVTRVLAIGTSALRNAKNGQEIASLFQHETGIEVRIISGDEEAGYIYAGVRKALRIGSEVSLIVDIGGGSVECILGNGKEVLWKRSFEIGAQRLLELFQRHDPILPNEVSKLKHYFDDSLKPLLDALQQFRPTVLIGSSGTFDTLSEMHCLLEGISTLPNSPETPLSFENFHRIFADLLVRDRTQRMQMPGMIEMRVDMIVVACCLIAWLLKKGSFLAIRVSSYSLKEGVLATLETVNDPI